MKLWQQEKSAKRRLRKKIIEIVIICNVLN